MQKICSNNMIKIETFKSGKFTLSNQCDFEKILPLLIRSDVLYETIKDLPILPDMASQLDKDLIRRSIHGTAAIEGNPLNEEEVSNILAESDTPPLFDKASTEIRNLKVAYDLLENMEKSSDPFILSEEFIKNAHKVITTSVGYPMNEPGVYRNHKVEVGDNEHGGKYIPPKVLVDIKNIMENFIVWINSKPILDETHPFIRAALAHYHLGIIHPFADGNGRTARALSYMYLLQQGYDFFKFFSISTVIREQKAKYYKAITDAEDNGSDLTYFVDFNAKMIIASISIVLKRLGKEYGNTILLNIREKRGLFNRTSEKMSCFFSENRKEIYNHRGILKEI